MNKRQCFQDIVDAFEQKYSFLGKSFAEELLYSMASYNLQSYSEPDFRIRRHLLLFWQHGQLKSCFLKLASMILGEKNCMMTSDVTHAALRGTVEATQFITPYTLKRPFGICTEFGQVVGSTSSDIVQKLLNILEEGIVTVSLAKIAWLSPEKKKEVQEKHGIKFLDENTFTYRTNWILIAGTYNKQFLVDNAFESRFVILTPEKKLDGAFLKHVVNSPPFTLDQEAIDFAQREIRKPAPLDCSLKLPNEVYDYATTMRDCGQIKSSILCRKWWNLKVEKEDIINMAKQISIKHDSVWKSSNDKVFDAILAGFNTIEEIMEYADLGMRQVYYCLKSLRARKRQNGGRLEWEII